MSQTMKQYVVKAPCGVENEFDNEDKALDGKDTHEALCDSCSQGDVELIDRQEAESQSDQSESESDAKEPADLEPIPESAERVVEESHDDLPEQQAGIDIETEEQFVKEIKGVPEPFVVNMGGNPHIRKSGYYYLASQMGLQVTTEPLSPTWEGDSEVSAYKGIVTDGEKQWSNVGTAHLDYEDMQDAAANLDELAATRAACRALSMATGTGVASMEEMIGENDER